MRASPRILVVGNSHTQALRSALAARAEEARPTHGAEVLRLKSPKDPRIGDASVEEVEAAAARLEPDDLLVLSRLGTQHYAYGTFQMDPPFSVVDLDTRQNRGPLEWEVIPIAVLTQALAMPHRDWSLEARLRRATTARTLHLAPPPAKRNLVNVGKRTVAPGAEPVLRIYNDPFVRLAVWKIEMAVLAGHLGHLGIEPLPPPGDACDEDGFLLPEFGADDVGHANAAYGELVLRQLEAALAASEDARLAALTRA